MRYRDPFLVHLRASVPSLVIMTIVGVLLGRAGVFGSVERLVVDLFAATEPNPEVEHTFIFDINDESYGRDFGRRSPLDPDKLAALVRAAIAAQARAVAVDVDTDRAKMQALLGDTGPVPVIWVRDADACDDGCVRPVGDDAFDATRHGLGTLLTDTDGVVRRYQPSFCSCAGGHATLLSFPRAVVNAAGFVTHEANEPLLLNWKNDPIDFPKIGASQVLASDTSWWGRAQPIRGRIVVIGGTFREARDRHRTPIGEMSGVQLMAHIIESEASGEGGLKAFGDFGAAVLDILVSVFLVWINWRYPAETRTGFALNAVVVLALPFVASWVLHRYTLFWINMGPVLAGVWISQWHDRAALLAKGHR